MLVNRVAGLKLAENLLADVINTSALELFCYNWGYVERFNQGVKLI